MRHRRTVTSLTALTLVLAALLPPLLPAQRPKAGPWLHRKPPEGWVVHESRSYQIQSQAGIEKAKRLANHMEAMLRVYRKRFRADKGSFKRYTIKLFKDRKAYLGYGAPRGTGGYYNKVDREMVTFDTGKWMDEAPTPETGPKSRERRLGRRGGMDVLGVAAHEGWHQYFHWYVTSWVQLPPWVNEGMGDYFYACRPRGKGRRSTLDPQVNRGRFPIIWSAVKSDKHVPIKQILSYSKADYYSNPSVCYAEGWAICYFLLHHKDKKLRRVLPTLIGLVRDDTNIPKITKAAFRGIDLDELEKEWKQWVTSDLLLQFRPKSVLPKASAGKSGTQPTGKPAKAGEGRMPSVDPSGRR